MDLTALITRDPAGLLQIKSLVLGFHGRPSATSFWETPDALSFCLLPGAPLAVGRRDGPARGLGLPGGSSARPLLKLGCL